MKKYQIRIKPIDPKEPSYIIEIETDRINWTMTQYQRNRPALKWEIVNED